MGSGFALLPIQPPEFVVVSHHLQGDISPLSLPKRSQSRSRFVTRRQKAESIICPGTARHHFSHHRQMAHGHQKGKGGKKDALIAGHYLMTMALLTHANLSDVLRNPRREMKGAVGKESLYLAFLSEWEVEFERAAL